MCVQVVTDVSVRFVMCECVCRYLVVTDVSVRFVMCDYVYAGSYRCFCEICNV